jgi:hypothetical protein
MPRVLGMPRLLQLRLPRLLGVVGRLLLLGLLLLGLLLLGVLGLQRLLRQLVFRLLLLRVLGVFR